MRSSIIAVFDLRTLHLASWHSNGKPMTTRNISCVLLLFTAMANSTSANPDEDFKKLRDEYLVKYKPLVIQSETAWWDANTTGSDEAFERRKQA